MTEETVVGRMNDDSKLSARDQAISIGLTIGVVLMVFGTMVVVFDRFAESQDIPADQKFVSNGTAGIGQKWAAVNKSFPYSSIGDHPDAVRKCSGFLILGSCGYVIP